MTTAEGFRDYAIRVQLGPGLSLDAAIDEINSHGRILYMGEAEAAEQSVPLDAELLRQAHANVLMKRGRSGWGPPHIWQETAAEYARLVPQPSKHDPSLGRSCRFHPDGCPSGRGYFEQPTERSEPASEHNIAAMKAAGCTHGEGCICIEEDHAYCCGVLRQSVLASMAEPARPAIHTAECEKAMYRGPHVCICGASNRAARTGDTALPAGLRKALAHAFEWARDPNEPKRAVIPTGYLTLLSSEVPAIRERQADLVVTFLEESGVVRAALAAQPTSAEQPGEEGQCEQTDGIGQPRWPNNRCVLAKGHTDNHQYERSQS